MNSKEALERLIGNKVFISLGRTQGKKQFVNDINIIEKDLEILEIIKKWSFIQENYKDGYGPYTQFLCNIHTIGMKEDFEKVKEWLENGR